MLALPVGTALAAPGIPAGMGDCDRAISQAERQAGIPPRLMAAIGRVESGRRDPATGVLAPWPWTINAEGQGQYFPTKAAAITAVRQLQARGVRSIDVGCMQINLMHHPAAFESLDTAFDPASNAAYAARFLTQLKTPGSSWEKATSAYHSATPALGEAYARKVMATWPDANTALANTLPAAGGGLALALPATPPNFGLPRGASMLANGADRARLIPMARGGDGGRSLDTYRRAPILAVTGPARNT